MQSNTTQQAILKHTGNTLVTANPGTGKTFLLSQKYISLLKNNVEAKNILCLTFTDKARDEMFERILKMIKEENLNVGKNDINIFTFHSYAKKEILEKKIVSENLMNFWIYKFVKSKEMFFYGDDYFIKEFIPKIIKTITYLKNYFILPEEIDLKELQQNLEKFSNYTKKEIDFFAKYFVEIFFEYEKVKSNYGYDYADLLLEFLKLENRKIYDYVLVDELQDVNNLEAIIALKSGKIFFAVGDKKQSIFGFQGGSVQNFELFQNSKQFILGDNYRSTNEILNYAKEFFISQSSDEKSKEEIKTLRSNSEKTGDKVKVFVTQEKKNILYACDFIEKLWCQNKKSRIALIGKTNRQLSEVAKILVKKNIPFVSTALIEAKKIKHDVLTFLLGIFSDDVDDIKESMFSMFFPKDDDKQIFEMASDKKFHKDDETIKDELKTKILETFSNFTFLKNGSKNLEIDELFNTYIFPVAILYGEEYKLVVEKILSVYKEAQNHLGENSNIYDVIDFISVSDTFPKQENMETKRGIMLTTIHKSKGLQFDKVIYIPKINEEKNTLEKYIANTILVLQNKFVDNLETNLKEDFVAITRAENNLYILCEDKNSDKFLLNEFIEIEQDNNLEIEKSEEGFFETENFWLIDLIKKHFDELKHISYSRINLDAIDYLKRYILKITKPTKSLEIGSQVHKIAQNILQNIEQEIPSEYKQYEENIYNCLDEIKNIYPQFIDAEKQYEVSLLQIINVSSSLKFKSRFDAIFFDGKNYLIIDWKTSSKIDTKYFQQLSLYKKIFSLAENIPIENIKVAVCYVALRSKINTEEKLKYKLEFPKRETKTFEDRISEFLDWKKNIHTFFEEVLEKEEGTNLWEIVSKQYKKEKK